MSRRTPIALGIAGLAAGVAAGAFVLTDDHGGRSATTFVLALSIGWSFVAAGLVAWQRRPANNVGRAMLFIGFAWFATALDSSDHSVLYTIGTALDAIYVVAFGYLLLIFPQGTLVSRADKALLGAAAFTVTGLQLAWMAVGDTRELICNPRCPPNALQVVDARGLAETILTVQRAIAIVLCAILLGLLVERWRRASRVVRRAAAPVLIVGVLTFAVIVVAVVDDLLGGPIRPEPELVWSILFALIPYAFLVSLLRMRLSRAAVADLVVDLGSSTQPGQLHQALARALGDPALELAYWLPDGERFVDADGRPVNVAQTAGRAVTLVEREGRRIAALLHDAALADEVELVESVAAAAALALENERLHAELRARLEELRASRARIVEAADDERRRIERNLHDATQQRLVSIAMALGLAEAKVGTEPETVAGALAEARAGILDALSELRELSQGIHPSILTERGLEAALRELAFRSPVSVDLDVSAPPMDEQVAAAAYYLVAESLANVAKHAHANAATVRVATVGDELRVEVADDGIGGAQPGGGSGLRGLTDRVEALGGKLWLASPPGRGTIVRAEIPTTALARA